MTIRTTGNDTGDTEVLCIANCKIQLPLLKTVSVSSKSSIVSPYDPEIILEDIYPTVFKIYFQTKICI
jgi:hypothetical protein